MRSGIMMAYPFKENLKWPMPIIIQPKLNGLRCRAIISDQGITLLSSQENRITSMPHIVAALRRLALKPIELDGELYRHGTAFQTLCSIVKRSKALHPFYGSVEYHIFDIISDKSQLDRVDALRFLAARFKPPLVHVESARIKEDEISAYLAYYMGLGYEGIILRNPDSPYVRARTPNMLKLKPSQSDTYKITGFNEEIDISGNPKNSLGSLECQRPDGGEIFKVGTGPYLTRERRDQLWQERDSLIGKMVKIKYQNLTLHREVPFHPVLMEVTEEGESAYV